MLLPHLASRLYGTPLLLARTKLNIILSVLGSRVGWPIQSELALPPSRASPAGQHMAATGIAVVPVHGSLVRRAMGIDAASGLTSYGDVAAMLDAAVADPTVSGILLDIDSPGGEAGGVFELAQHVRAIDAIKAFDTIFVITQGGPGTASETINIFLYLQAFAFYNIGYASAVVVVFFVIIVALTLVLLWARQRTQWTLAT